MILSRTTRKDPTYTKTLRESYRRDLVRLFTSYRRDALLALDQAKDTTSRMMAAADIDLIRLDEVLRASGAELVTKGTPITRDHVLQNYTAGTGFGTKQLNRIGVEAVIGDGPADWRVMDALKVRNLSALRGVTDEMNKQIIRELSDGINLGESMPKLAKRITGRVDSIGIVRATAIARTETLHAFNQGAELRYAQAGIETLEWLSAHDPPRVCEECLALDKTTFRVKSGHPRPPIHVNCFIEGTLLESPGDIVAAFRAWYDGEIIKLTISDGRQVSVTPNHMFLTSHGFIAAKFVRNGDNIICRTGFKRSLFSINPNNNHVQPTVEEVFHSFGVSGGVTTRSVPPSPEYLHNDGIFVKGDIDVITSDRFLLGACNPAICEHLNKYGLRSANPKLPEFSCDGGLASVLIGLAFAADGGLSSGRDTASFFRGRLAHSDIVGFAAIPGGDSILIESKGDDVTGAAEVSGELFDRHSGIVHLHEFGNVDVDSAGRMYPEVCKPEADCICANSKLTSELINAHPGVIELQKVISVDVDSSYHGYIYDFQTLSTLCIGNGVITSNCRCTVIPVLGKPPLKGKGDTVRGITDNINETRESATAARREFNAVHKWNAKWRDDIRTGVRVAPKDMIRVWTGRTPSFDELTQWRRTFGAAERAKKHFLTKDELALLGKWGKKMGFSDKALKEIALSGRLNRYDLELDDLLMELRAIKGGRHLGTKAAITKYEKRIWGRPGEELYIVDKNGQRIYFNSASEKGIAGFTDIRGNAANGIMLMNQADGTVIMIEDYVRQAAKLKLGEVRMVAGDKVHIIRRTGKWDQAYYEDVVSPTMRKVKRDLNAELIAADKESRIGTGWYDRQVWKRTAAQCDEIEYDEAIPSSLIKPKPKTAHEIAEDRAIRQRREEERLKDVLRKIAGG